MKKIFYLATAVIILVACSVFFAGAADDFTDSTSAEISETETIIEIEDEIASEVVEIIETADSRGEAIITLAEQMGISYEDAELLINSMIEVGDKYLGDSGAWIKFKQSVQNNMETWIIIGMIALLAISFVWWAISNHLKNGKLKSVEYNMQKLALVVDEMSKVNSQTLENLLKNDEKHLEKESNHMEHIQKTVSEIERLERKNVDQDDELIKLKRSMIESETYILRMLKLLADRTRMPMTDKATIDLFYAKGADPLKANLSEDEIKKVEETAHTLDAVGVADD